MKFIAQIPCRDDNEHHSYLIDSLDQVHCDVVLTKQLINCEHSARLSCSTDPQKHTCTAPCRGIMTCCRKDCKFHCSQCQGMNTGSGNGIVKRIRHMNHPCEKPLFCGHSCGKNCSQDHVCETSCKRECRQQCI